MKIANNFLQNYEISRMCIFALFFTLGLGLSLLISACSPSATSNSAVTQTGNQSSVNQGVVIRIGYQKAATILNAMRTQKDLEKAFAASGASVTWAKFPSGSAILHHFQKYLQHMKIQRLVN
ncbi:hypothetical protein I8748_20265 [Nostoc sp. CENA67]|uniref:Uncharacterized protein n=1 Tax=Amazonocrinis nigriterrae CENA67 TaxID=2794033 RepID=A0A8J7HY70_9NOST|nr:hypothetical protein [Amazonocrinis nigriterrae]MBH8564489.1 hypothetical protein [Amazonocrinis nigriterrae CENA67]